jgi:hypothetical protein
VERGEAEAIYDVGRERCVDFILELARRSQELATRAEQLAQRCGRSTWSSGASVRPDPECPGCPPAS